MKNNKELIAKWLKELQLDEWEIDTKTINPDQVYYDEDVPKDERYFIGIKYDEETKTAVIYHDRKLTEKDILHELIHVKFPYYEEYEVIEATDYFMKRKTIIMKNNKIKEIGSGYKNFLKSKLGLSSEEDEKVFAERLAICKACPNVTKINTCSLCGCPLDVKTKSMYSECADKENRRW